MICCRVWGGRNRPFFFLQVTPIEINEGLIIVEFFLPFFSNELIMRHSDSFVRMMSLLLLLFKFRKVRTIMGSNYSNETNI